MPRSPLPTVVGFALSSVGLSATPEFEQWALKFQKQYPSDLDYSYAVSTFLKNAEAVVMLNSDQEDGATYGHTHFSDMTPEDFKSSRFPGFMDAREGLRGGAVAEDLSEAVPDAFDWREQGAVTGVKDQSNCGSCWAESAVGNMESLWYLANKASMKAPVELSVQEVIECDDHDYACYGGYPRGAFEYVIGRGGISSEVNYPYNINGHVICLANQTFNETCGLGGLCDDPPLTSFCDQTCSDKVAQHAPVAKFSSWVALTQGEDYMAAFLASHGPISIGINGAGRWGQVFPWLQFYHHGVANPKGCTDKIDHGVLIVGYGVDGATKYWTIKNSWGEKFGESGYFRLIRGSATCGVTSMPSSAVVSAAAPAIVV